MVLNSLTMPGTHAPAGFGCWWESIELHTSSAPEFVDITERVERAIAKSGILDGIAVIFSRHTTAAVVINENEPLLLKDMMEFLERLAPCAAHYRHNDFRVRTVNMTPDESPNGHAHCLQLVLGASQTVPVQRGRLVLGQWQKIFLVELDHARPRQVMIQTMGVASSAADTASMEPERNEDRSPLRV